MQTEKIRTEEGNKAKRNVIFNTRRRQRQLLQVLLRCLLTGIRKLLYFLPFRPRSVTVNGEPKYETMQREFCEKANNLNCAKKDWTGFWYNSCSAVNLNGRIFRSSDENFKYKDGMIWERVNIYSTGPRTLVSVQSDIG